MGKARAKKGAVAKHDRDIEQENDIAITKNNIIVLSVINGYYSRHESFRARSRRNNLFP